MREGICGFELTDRQRQIRLAAQEFAECMFSQVAEECDLNETFPMELWPLTLLTIRL